MAWPTWPRGTAGWWRPSTTRRSPFRDQHGRCAMPPPTSPASAGAMPGWSEAYEVALALWRGPALGEFASWPFAQAEAARLDEAHVAAVEDLAEAELALGRTASALARLEPVVRRCPL